MNRLEFSKNPFKHHSGNENQTTMNRIQKPLPNWETQNEHMQTKQTETNNKRKNYTKKKTNKQNHNDSEIEKNKTRKRAGARAREICFYIYMFIFIYIYICKYYLAKRSYDKVDVECELSGNKQKTRRGECSRNKRLRGTKNKIGMDTKTKAKAKVQETKQHKKRNLQNYGWRQAKKRRNKD